MAKRLWVGTCAMAYYSFCFLIGPIGAIINNYLVAITMIKEVNDVLSDKNKDKAIWFKTQAWAIAIFILIAPIPYTWLRREYLENSGYDV